MKIPIAFTTETDNELLHLVDDEERRLMSFGHGA